VELVEFQVLLEAGDQEAQAVQEALPEAQVIMEKTEIQGVPESQEQQPHIMLAPCLEKFRASALKYFDQRVPMDNRWKWNAPIHSIHQMLIESTLGPTSGSIPLRRASLCRDNTPIVYSQYLSPQEIGSSNGEQKSIRILVEPGGIGITIAEQINKTLFTTDQIIHYMGWQNVIDDLNGIVVRVFPLDASALSHWWGGMWLGLAAYPNDIQFRLYMNLRYGSEKARWQRFADVLGFLGDETLEEPLKQLISNVAPTAIPVGLGVVLANSRIATLRLYVGVHQPNQKTLHSLLLGLDGPDGSIVARLCEGFKVMNGEFNSQSVTAGYDFHLDHSGIIEPCIARSKLDISCQCLPQEHEPALLALISRLSKEWQLDENQLKNFLSDLSKSFGAYRIEYISFSFADEMPKITVYAKPDGYIFP
jgi:hypothetical protein